MPKSKLAGWVLSGLIALMLIGPSAGGKLMDYEGKEKMFGEMGWQTSTMFYIGIVEIAIAIIYLIPRTGFIGAILVTAYLGGATATHVRVSQPFAAFADSASPVTTSGCATAKPIRQPLIE